MFIQLQCCSPPNRFLSLKIPLPPLNQAQNLLSVTPPLYPFLRLHTFRARIPTISGRLRAKFQPKTIKRFEQIEADADEGDLEKGDGEECSSGGGSESDKEDYEAADEEFSHASAYRGRRDEKDYDRDPELADILGSCFDDPKKAQSKVEERIRRKRSKILHTKTGSATPMKVRFNKFDFSNSYIWIEFYNAPLPQDVTLICDTIRAWHIIGRLGGCNSMNMQLSQSAMDNKRPRYDAIQGANVTPTTFYNIGDLELQDNLARIWIDIGTGESLLLDVLVNALSCISSELEMVDVYDVSLYPRLTGRLLQRNKWLGLLYMGKGDTGKRQEDSKTQSYVGIKEVIFGGSESQNWKENMISEDADCSTHKI